MTDLDQKPDRDSEGIKPSPPGAWELIKRPLRKVPGYAIAQIVYHQFRIRYGRPMRKLKPRIEKPSLILIETSSMCNLSCPKCYYRKTTRPRGLIDKDLVIDILDQARDVGLTTVCLSQAGEPLIHPELETFIAAARERKLFPYFITNATLLSEERARSLIQAGLLHMVVSFDGWDEASYSERQTGSRMERVIANLKRMKELRGASRWPSLNAVTVLDTGSLPHFREIKKVVAPLVDYFAFQPLFDFGVPGWEVERNLLLGTGSWKRSPCYQLWQDFTIGSDGRVTACCNDQEYHLAYHSVREAGIKEIWNHPTIQEWRRLHLEGRYGDMPLCGKCTLDFLRSWRYAWIKRRLVNVKI